LDISLTSTFPVFSGNRTLSFESMRHSDLLEADHHWLTEKPHPVPMVTRSFHNDVRLQMDIEIFWSSCLRFHCCDGIVAMRVANGTKKSYGEVSW
jgi:hypothetical protein